jgi:acyl-coenzyme A synthetase/AMP-(fatty) acid ligase
MEDLLLNHPDVIDAAVCAVYDDAQATEVPLAYVSLQQKKAELPPSQMQAVLDDIRTWADGQVAGYKKLRGGVLHLQTLPKNPTGKILRRMLPVKLKESRVQKL